MKIEHIMEVNNRIKLINYHTFEFVHYSSICPFRLHRGPWTQPWNHRTHEVTAESRAAEQPLELPSEATVSRLSSVRDSVRAVLCAIALECSRRF